MAWKICLEGDFSLEDKLPKIVIHFLGPIRRYIVKEKYIGLEVRYILLCIQTDKHMEILLLLSNKD